MGLGRDPGRNLVVQDRNLVNVGCPPSDAIVNFSQI